LAVLKEENMKRLFTSESVTEGHPDKLCDYISDSILDSYLAKDKNARVACETVAGKGEIFITGEITSTANVDIEQVVRDTIKEVGYADSEYDIDYRTCKIYINLSKQSPDIALGVDKSLEDKEGKDVESEGAGDQGLMFGYACDETEELMPLPISLAHKLSKRLTEVRREKIIDYLRPDGKTQVTVEYDGDKPVRIDTIVVSTQHLPDVDMNVLKKDIIEKVIKPIVPANLLDENTKYFINPTGRFVIGGPLGDSGLTGRKIIVDTYGGAARHGGGAFSGKDPTKVDRSASYMARHIAKNIVANGYAKKCEIQIAYSIGVAKPVSIYVNTYGTNTIPEEEIVEKIDKTFDLTPRGIINYLDLQRPIYRQTTNYGHFGKKDLPWEKIINF
jgi:methionine adenosyltransferase